MERLNVLKNKKIIIYGTGYVAMKFYYALASQGVDKNIECFVVSQKQEDSECINGIKVRSIDEFVNDDTKIICLAVHATSKKEIEEILIERNITNYIWIDSYFLVELFLGKPIQHSICMSVDALVQRYSDYRITARYVAIERYFGKNDCGFDIYKKVQKLYCGEETAEKRLVSFCNLIQDWENYGFRLDFPILIDSHNELLDGTHRLALAKYYQMDEIVCDVFRSSPWVYEWLGSDVLLSRDKVLKIDFTDKEMETLETAYKRVVSKRR